MDDESEQVIMFLSSKHGVLINGRWERTSDNVSKL